MKSWTKKAKDIATLTETGPAFTLHYKSYPSLNPQITSGNCY